MAFDGLFTCAVTFELSQKLTLGKIEKIYQPAAEELVFIIHTKDGNKKLYMSCASSHARVHLSSENFENPATPLAFCMLMRKHLSGGRVQRISQKETERIIEFDIETMNELGFSVNKRLIVEIMGKHSNIILIDIASGKIIDCIKRVSIDVNRIRQLLPGKIYEYPPSQDKVPFFDVTKETLSDILPNMGVPTATDTDTDTAAALDTSTLAGAVSPELLSKSLLRGIQGISPAIAESLAMCVPAAVDIVPVNGDVPPTSTADLVWTEIQKMQLALSQNRSTVEAHKTSSLPEAPSSMLSASSDSLTPLVYLDENGTPYEFHVFPLNHLASICEAVPFGTVSEAVEYYFQSKTATNRIKQKSTDLERALKASLDKLYLKKQRLSEDIFKAQNSENYRLYGELINANLHNIKTGDSSANLLNYYDETYVTIPLDIRFSPAKNAQNYFKKYGKSKTAVKEKNIQLDDTNMDIAYLESSLTFVENATTIEQTELIREELIENGFLRRRKNAFGLKKLKSKPLEFTIGSGYRVLVGKNNKENDILTFKTANSRDIWFHTKDIPGSHVILFTDGKSLDEIEDEVIYKSAGLAAFHSKAKTSENVPVDYVQVKYVKKPNGAKPGMVIFTNNRTVWVNPWLPDSTK